jgi:hypothetical protein
MRRRRVRLWGISVAKMLLADRFWRHVKKDDPCGCWTWLGTKGRYGYGMFSIRKGKLRLAHRISYQLAHGEIPTGKVICHHCDNPPCVNPAHLFLGTQADNLADMFRKGRGVLPPVHVGTKNRHAKLTEQQVLAIRNDTRLRRVVAKEYGVSDTLICWIISRKIWKHLPSSVDGLCVTEAS